MVISHSVLLRMRNVSDTSCTENQTTQLIFDNFPSENRAIYEIMWKSIVKPGRPQTTKWRMCITCWISKATNTYSHYVILIASPPQQLLHKRASILCYTYIVCVVVTSNGDSRCFLWGKN